MSHIRTKLGTYTYVRAYFGLNKIVEGLNLFIIKLKDCFDFVKIVKALN